MFTIEQVNRLNDRMFQHPGVDMVHTNTDFRFTTRFEEHQDYLALVLKDVVVDLSSEMLHPICIPDVLTILEHLLNFDILEVNERAKEHIMESL